MVSTSRSKVFAGFLLIFCALFAGCIGGDDDPAGSEAEEEQEPLPEDQVQVRGDVRDAASLDPVNGAQVTLVQNGEGLASAQTDEEGSYELGGIEPGQYQLQVTSITHRSDARGVVVEEGESAEESFLLEAFPTASPHSERLDWTGFMTLGSHDTVTGIRMSCCTDDPNAETSYDFPVTTENLRTIVVEAYWDNDNAGLHGYLWKNPNCDPGCNPDQEYAGGGDNGFGNLSFRADHETGAWPGFDYDQEEEELSIYLFPERGEEPATVMYQQQWTVYIEMFYVKPAPEGHIVRPDQ